MVSFLVLHRLVDQKDTPVINILLDHPSQMYPLLLVGEKVSYLNECGVYVCVFLEFLTRRSRVTLNENSFTEADMAGFRKQLVKHMLVQQRPTDFIASFTA